MKRSRSRSASQRTCTAPRNASVAQVRSCNFWRSLAPGAHVCDGTYLQKQRASTETIATAVKESDILEWQRSLCEDGYFSAPPVAMDLTRMLAEIVGALIVRGWHPAFVAMYDEFWVFACIWLKLMHRIVSPTLAFNGDIYAFHVSGATFPPRGWPAHRDRAEMPNDALGLPIYVTIWTALTDSTMANGCIRVLPRSKEQVKEAIEDPEDPEEDNSLFKALEAPSGTSLAWGGRTLHYGGHCQSSAPPRLSVAMAFSDPAFESCAERDLEEPLRDVGPQLDIRLRLVACQLWYYDDVQAVPLGLRILLERLDEPGAWDSD